MNAPIKPMQVAPTLGSSWLRFGAWWIAAAYGLAATLWILFSDHALGLVVRNQELLLRWSVYKGLGFVAATTALLFLLLRHVFRMIEAGYACLTEKERQLSSSEDQLKTILHSAMDAVLIVDPEKGIVLFNTTAEQMFGCSASEAQGKPLSRFIPEIVPSDRAANLLLQGRRVTGEEFPIEASISRDKAEDRELITLILRDITQRKAHETEIDRLNRLYSALSHINQAIVWAPSQEELFNKVCHALVEHGDFRMAWIGRHDLESNSIVPLSAWDGRSENIADIPTCSLQSGPAAAAFREVRPWICNNTSVVTDNLRLWPEHAHAEIRAFAIFPIRTKKGVFGTINVYSKDRDVFQDKEISLLAEAATDVSFALEHMEDKEKQRLAEVAAENEKVFSGTMIESMPGVVYFYDNLGRFLRWNRNMETVSGYTGEEIAKMHPTDFFAGEDIKRVLARIDEVFTQGESFVEASFVAKDGSSKPYLFTGRRIVYEDSVCLVGMGVDISERQVAEQALRLSEERYRSTLDGIMEGCQLIGFDWRYLYLNDAAALHNRRPNSEILGRTMLESWPGIDASDIFKLLQRCMQERIPLHAETEFCFPDGNKAWFDVRSQPVPEGIFVLSIDISERKKAEAALFELNQGLELKVAERTEELQTALVRAEAADRIKSAFLATMSHELRTPLNSIIGFTGIVLQGLAGPLNPEQSKQLGMVRGSARHLLELINDVLDLSKIEAGQLEVRAEPFDLTESIERVTSSVRLLAEQKGLSLHVEIPPALGSIVTDRRRMEQILINLINNAIKFTDQGSVTLIAKPDDTSQTIDLCVRDTGIGISPEDLATLFQPFRQVDSGLSRQHDGTGLGLAICRRLATLLGGSISVSSTSFEGSEFILTLPRELPQPHVSHHSTH